MFYLFTGSGSDHPTPYSAYQFQIEAANSVGSVTSPYSTSVTTDASSKFIHDPQVDVLSLGSYNFA